MSSSNEGDNRRAGASKRRTAAAAPVSSIWLKVPNGWLTKSQFLRMQLSLDRSRSCPWPSSLESLVLDRDYRAVHVDFDAWWPCADVKLCDDIQPPSQQDDVWSVSDRWLNVRRSTGAGALDAERPQFSVNTRKQSASALERLNEVCLGSMIFVANTHCATELAAAIARNRDVRRELTEATRLLRLDSIAVLDRDVAGDATATGETVRVEHRRATASTAEYGSETHGTAQNASLSGLAQSEHAAGGLAQNAMDSEAVDEHGETVERLETGSSERQDNARARSEDALVQRRPLSRSSSHPSSNGSSGAAAVAVVAGGATTTANDRVERSSEDSGSARRREEVNERERDVADATRDSRKVERSLQHDSAALLTIAKDAFVHQDRFALASRGRRGQHTVTVQRDLAGGGTVNPDRTQVEVSVSQADLDGSQTLHSSEARLATDLTAEKTATASGLTREAVDRVRGTKRHRLERRESDELELNQSSAVTAGGKRRKYDLALDLDADEDGPNSSDASDAVVDELSSNRRSSALDVHEEDESTITALADASSEGARRHQLLGRAESRTRQRTAMRNVSLAESVEGGADHVRARDAAMRTILLSRRCVSVLQRVLLSPEYRRAKVRSAMRYEDLAVRLAVAEEKLDERGRREVGDMFCNVRRRYFASLYEVTYLSFRFFYDTANAMLRVIWSVASLWPWRSCFNLHTHDWLLRRVIEEYSRVQFLRLFEYVRLFELYRQIRADEEPAPEPVADHDDDVDKLPAIAEALANVDFAPLRPQCSLPHGTSDTVAMRERTSLAEVRGTLRKIQTCVRTVEYVLTQRRDKRSPAIRALRRIASMHGLVAAAWSTVRANAAAAAADSAAAAAARFEQVWPVWNLRLIEQQGCEPRRRGGGRPSPDSSMAQLAGVEDDEYFELHRLLAACDRSSVRVDQTFYTGLFSRLHRELLQASVA